MPKVVSPILAKVELITKEKEGDYGLYRSVLFKNGEGKIWQSFDPDAEELQIFKKGMTVQLIPRGESKSGKTQYNIVLLDSVSVPNTAPAPQAPAPVAAYGVMSEAQKYEAAAYIEQMAKMYRYCYEQAQISLTGATESPETVRAAASTLFIAAQRKFGI
jgi:hypothetical protein